MKRILTLVAAGLLFGSAHAQLSPVTFGPKLGVNYSTTILDQDNVTLANGSRAAVSSEYRLGFVGGAFVRVTLGKFILEPSAVYSIKGGKLKLSTTNQEVDVNYSTLDIPVMIGFQLFDAKLISARLVAGPMFTYALDGDVENTPQFNTQRINDSFNDATVGFQGGIGVDVAKIAIDARYERIFNSAASQALGRPGNGLLQVTVGFKII